MSRRFVRFSLSLAIAVGGLSAAAAAAQGASEDAPDPRAAAVARHWTPDRVAAAEPRDLVLDDRGLAYRRDSAGKLEPHGHTVAATVGGRTEVRATESAGATSAPAPRAKPVADSAGPSVSAMDPAAGTTIGAEKTFTAVVTDPSGLRSVKFVIVYPNGTTGTFSATRGTGDTWSVGLSGFTDGAWAWRVVATDGSKGGNVTTSPTLPFTVDASAAPQPGTGAVVNEEWTQGGDVQSAAGRIYFEMPANRSGTSWDGYVCSGTVATDSATGESVIITAAHCVYDDVNKTFARNVLFIPDQAGGGSPTDVDCTNDPYGCWAPVHGVVDDDWTTRTFPDNIPWDYAYYVVPGAGAHTGAAASSDSLEAAVGTLPVDFSQPAFDLADASDVTHALGYSYSDDPNFMYCAEDMTTEGTDNWWLPSCGLSGGASGGPWVQPMSGGTGPIMSVNSWGYTSSPGMAGPKLAGTSAACLFDIAQSGADGVNRGIVGTC
ncbi:hypothetical protein [Georgenia daeguensis]|uniref:Trypsin-like serine protease n=1 Tax=Georgenia daeguensis TaxID=908355 RepID=A0ABP6ULI0_9MICO